jgi:cell wall-associated NlpC family hydrolase
VYYHARAYEYLVLRTAGNKSWYRVLLSNYAFGYVRADAVAVLPKDVIWHQHAAPRVTSVTGRGLASRGEIARYAQNFLGTPYKWGGNDIVNGIDCSGFVKKLYGAIGVSLPRTAELQSRVGQPIYRLEDLLPGDRLYFWSYSRHKIGHTGIYIGGGYFTHASSGHHGVATDFLSAKWRKILVAARR